MTYPIVKELREQLRGLDPQLAEGAYVFAHADPHIDLRSNGVIGSFAESEGVTLILPEEEAQQHGLKVAFRCEWITLRIHSDLLGVGLTAAVSRALADAGISCNMVSAIHHDHVFVPYGSGARALECLQDVQERSAL